MTNKHFFKKIKRTVACWRFFGEKRAAFSTGSIVRISGYYVCVPCGYKKFLRKDNLFPKCSSCGGPNKIFRWGFFYTKAGLGKRFNTPLT